MHDLVKFTLPEELINHERFLEGAKSPIVVNAYERNLKARAACLAHYGYDCAVCGLNFENVYGPIGKEYIHVHHIVSLAEIGERYEVDPIMDLRPVCPNCHAMLHRGETLLPLEELIAMLKSRQDNFMQ